MQLGMQRARSGVASRPAGQARGVAAAAAFQLAPPAPRALPAAAAGAAQQQQQQQQQQGRAARLAAAQQPRPQRLVRAAAAGQAAAPPAPADQVLSQLRRIIDPDFGEDIVACGFVKDLQIDQQSGEVAFKLELTTPACPVKDQFKREATAYVQELPWVRSVDVTITSQPKKPLVAGDNGRPGGLRGVRHIIAVSSCKGGVGKSTTSVNLALTLAQMGAKVGIFDADVYGPSLPTMVSPELRILRMDPETRAIVPTEYEGVKLVSFGFAGQGSAIMRGAMVSGLIQQMLTTAEWGDLDYLVLDFPPGTGDIQLTLCQTVAISAAVVVTTPQRLAFVDVAKGIRMFAKLAVPCVAVVENMSYFDGDDGRRYRPFGEGSGARIQADFGVPNLVRFPIVPELSAAGDGGTPLVVSDPAGPVGTAFMELGAAVVREVAKLSAGQSKNSVSWDEARGVVTVKLSGRDAFSLRPADVRRADTSAATINEWTGERVAPAEVGEGIKPMGIAPVGNYAVQITWEDGFNQVAPFEVLAGLEPQAVESPTVVATVGGLQATAEITG
ncbi:Fe-S cluster assembly factor, chloroplastic [Raphidocelis subcapitata]|uniref:Fe-S cluster assembly factor, chloroplastic n=1 Tax=Raphidocelis subcapitata TaxID=307507 RepID=A0A2V0NPE3_9CHLO|nr:Fe-S cluster assembly factor, chloroplastic [Raphidocelis subcapitata]|eukprot:GBF89139.1 Fe-S cluster assembly factor, chloroplastic [Raphidocelis subcapitata]